ncbi:MAG: DoxX family protein [Candidatus Koribacter versatilis]|uniref:DoxX family protein n=1 Tax=Candidatus Korobacter versatilis TaxID=658062 RepID=A0A932A8H6_9BACT|nr:DoxX family protein [Candidatus Koribacter versatilis]
MIRYLDRLQPFGVLVLRLVLGAIMAAHGYPKVFGGLQHNADVVASLGIPGWLGYVSAFAEFGGGLFLVFGILTRFAALVTLVNMLVAVGKVHWKNGFVGQGNYQFPLALAAMALLLIFTGGGAAALDRWLFRPGGPPRSKPKTS